MIKSELVEYIYKHSPTGFVLLDGYLRQIEVHYPYHKDLDQLSWKDLKWYNLTPAVQYGPDDNQLHWGFAVWEDHDPFDYWVSQRGFAPKVILKNAS